MGRKSSLFIIIGLLLLLAAGGVAAMSLFSPSISQTGDVAGQQATAEPTTPVVVAQIDIAKNTLIDAPDQFLAIENKPISQVSEETNFSDLQALRNMVATADIAAGQPVTKSDVREAGLAQKIPAPSPGQPSLKAFPVQVNSLSGVADLIQPGDFVDVIASFNLDIVTLRPGVPQRDQNGLQPVLTEQATNEGTSRVLLQDVEVIDVLHTTVPTASGEEGSTEPTPAPVSEGGQTPNAAVPGQPGSTAATTLNTGNWMLVLAVTNQEAEVLRFSLDRGIGLTTVLRRTGDHTTERTVGATMRILVDNYGMPMPALPQVMQQPGPVGVDRVPTLPPVDASKAAPSIEAR